jgi:hypothetical protein
VNLIAEVIILSSSGAIGDDSDQRG